MKYTQGTIGRVFLVKFEDKDVLREKIEELVCKEKIKTATIIFLGALRGGTLIAGPKKAVIPPVPNSVLYRDGWEVMGIGSVFSGDKGPQIHIHVSMGKKQKTLVGCVRDSAKTFLVLEAVILELRGVKASKGIDPSTGLNVLRI